MDQSSRDHWLTLATAVAFSALAAYQVYTDRDRSAKSSGEQDASGSDGLRRRRSRGSKPHLSPEEEAMMPTELRHMRAVPVPQMQRARSCPALGENDGAHSAFLLCVRCANDSVDVVIGGRHLALGNLFRASAPLLCKAQQAHESADVVVVKATDASSRSKSRALWRSIWPVATPAQRVPPAQSEHAHESSRISAPSTPTLASRRSTAATAASGNATHSFIADTPASATVSLPAESAAAEHDTEASRALSEEPSELGEFIHAPAPLTEAQRAEAEEARAIAEEAMRRSSLDPFHGVDPQMAPSVASDRSSQRSGSGRRSFAGRLSSWWNK